MVHPNCTALSDHDSRIWLFCSNALTTIFQLIQFSLNFILIFRLWPHLCAYIRRVSRSFNYGNICAVMCDGFSAICVNKRTQCASNYEVNWDCCANICDNSFIYATFKTSARKPQPIVASLFLYKALHPHRYCSTALVFVPLSSFHSNRCMVSPVCWRDLILLIYPLYIFIEYHCVLEPIAGL